MHTELKNLQAELAALTPRPASLSLYSDEGRRVASRIEYLEKRIPLNAFFPRSTKIKHFMEEE